MIGSVCIAYKLYPFVARRRTRHAFRRNLLYFERIIMLGRPIVVFQSACTQGLIMRCWAKHWRTWLLQLSITNSINHLVWTLWTWSDFIFTDYYLSISDDDSTIAIKVWLWLLQDATFLLSKLIYRVQMLGLEWSQVGDLLIKWDFSL